MEKGERKIKVELLDHMGSDNMVVDAARVSFNKTSDNYTDKQNSNLIKYLRNHDHWSPFSHCIAQFRITAPIYVARQLFRHQVGLSVNEISRRYVDYEPTFDIPDTWRKRPDKSIKQGSGDKLTQATQDIINRQIQNHLEKAKALYDILLKTNVAPEQARMILPQCTETSWIWTGTLESWLRICKLRLAEDAQTETRQIVIEIAKHIKELFPVSWETSNIENDIPTDTASHLS